MNSAELAQNLIERAMQLQEFRIVQTLPEDFMFNGEVPFDLTIRDDLMTFKVHAVTLAEANAKVAAYLRTNRDDD